MQGRCGVRWFPKGNRLDRQRQGGGCGILLSFLSNQGWLPVCQRHEWKTCIISRLHRGMLYSNLPGVCTLKLKNNLTLFFCTLTLFSYLIKEARNSSFGLGMYLLKSIFCIEDKLRFPWCYTTFSTYDQSLFSDWFPSNNYHHNNGSF